MLAGYQSLQYQTLHPWLYDQLPYLIQLLNRLHQLPSSNESANSYFLLGCQIQIIVSCVSVLLITFVTQFKTREDFIMLDECLKSQCQTFDPWAQRWLTETVKGSRCKRVRKDERACGASGVNVTVPCWIIIKLAPSPWPPPLHRAWALAHIHTFTCTDHFFNWSPHLQSNTRSLGTSEW